MTFRSSAEVAFGCADEAGIDRERVFVREDYAGMAVTLCVQGLVPDATLDVLRAALLRDMPMIIKWKIVECEDRDFEAFRRGETI